MILVLLGVLLAKFIVVFRKNGGSMSFIYINV